MNDIVWRYMDRRGLFEFNGGGCMYYRRRHRHRHRRHSDGRWFEGRRSCMWSFGREIVDLEVDNRIQNHPFHGLEERSNRLGLVVREGYIVLIILIFSAIVVLTVIIVLILRRVENMLFLLQRLLHITFLLLLNGLCHLLLRRLFLLLGLSCFIYQV